MATYGKFVSNLHTGLHDSDGNPLSGGKVYTYAAGTTNDKQMFTDRAKTTPAANPIILDTFGRAEVYADGLYYIKVYDSDDVLQFDMDDMDFTDTTSITDHVPQDHDDLHEDGGAQEVDVGGLSGELADDQPPKTHKASHVDGTDDIRDATSGQKGLATAAQIAKLDAIDAGAAAFRREPQIQDSQDYRITAAVGAKGVLKNLSANEVTTGDGPTRWTVYLTTDIDKLSYVFKMKSSDGGDTAYVQAKIQATLIGTNQNTTNVAYTQKSESDIDISGVVVADGWYDISLIGYNSDGTSHTYVNEIAILLHKDAITP